MTHSGLGPLILDAARRLSDPPWISAFVPTVIFRSIHEAYYREYNPDSAGTRRDECLVGDSRRQVLVDGDKGIEVVQE